MATINLSVTIEISINVPDRKVRQYLEEAILEQLAELHHIETHYPNWDKKCECSAEMISNLSYLEGVEDEIVKVDEIVMSDGRRYQYKNGRMSKVKAPSQ